MKQQPFVLIVEDDDSLRTAIVRNLQANGYLVFEAANFSQALDEIAVKPNLMILDINLPDANDWDIADWLEAETSAMPIIVIAGFRPDAKKMEKFKPKAFLPRPFPIQDLMALVRKYAPVPSAH